MSCIICAIFFVIQNIRLSLLRRYLIHKDFSMFNCITYVSKVNLDFDRLYALWHTGKNAYVNEFSD